ncbi:MAG: DUF488 family protein [Chryseosolibacter sp.]
MPTHHNIKTKRIDGPPSADDRYRVPVDRLWPRRVRKEDAKLDDRMKSLAPSPSLRKWFDHRPDRFEEFTIRYREALAEEAEILMLLSKLSDTKRVTLLYAAKDAAINHAVVLPDVLQTM